MSTKPRLSTTTRWLLTVLVIASTVLIGALRPSDEAQQAACVNQCLPRQGIWKPDPELAARDTSGRGVPRVCVCQ